ncbi:hypothetical protein N658DRAFT_145074 [Parathielavia hyrcaniae]|uniref:Uncharacterized protein n=1 Tax=Parathielavia hyrcaniae TaxID=113614 RepID=A0AAN6T0R7_9PEZI|nr:hypothetical protein N658DRAFT_145074 [Parathielavia hyrcaniae]
MVNRHPTPRAAEHATDFVVWNRSIAGQPSIESFHPMVHALVCVVFFCFFFITIRIHASGVTCWSVSPWS